MYGGETGVIVNAIVSPSSTVCGVAGSIVPWLPSPASGVTVCVMISNVALTVQSAVIGPVVYVSPIEAAAATRSRRRSRSAHRQ